MTERKVLYMSFIDAGGKNASVSIANPKDDLSLEAVRKVAETLLAKPVLEGPGGALTAFKSARIVTTVSKELE